jgi:hypothetical protein
MLFNLKNGVKEEGIVHCMAGEYQGVHCLLQNNDKPLDTYLIKYNYIIL